MILTPWQRRALEWLPVDGSWREQTAGRLGRAVQQLAGKNVLVEQRTQKHDDEYWYEFRLTPAGVAERGMGG